MIKELAEFEIFFKTNFKMTKQKKPILKSFSITEPNQKTILNFGKMELSLGLEWKTLEKMGGF